MLLQVHTASKTFFVKPTLGWERLKELGFEWDQKHRVWTTKNLQAAATLREHASAEAERFLKRYLFEVAPWLKPLPEDLPGKVLKPHQKDAVKFALSRNRSYLALDPGLGKTAIAATISRALFAHRIVYISPPFLLENVKQEFKTWAPYIRVRTIYDETPASALIVPDSMLVKPEIQNMISEFIGDAPALLFVDEAHRFKSHRTKRTIALFGNRKKPGVFFKFNHQVFLSGTPMPNRPIELYPILSNAVPNLIGNISRFEFGMKYCKGFQTDYGWNFDGCSNLKELAEKIKHPSGPFMLRIKKDVLDLPPKIEEVFILSDPMSREVRDLDFSILKEIAPKGGELVSVIMDGVEIERWALHTATYRRLIGVEKAKLIIPYLKSILDETDEAIIVYGYHKEVIEILKNELCEYEPLVIVGGTDVKERHKLVQQFQKEKRRRLFIGSYIAMGVGFTLTKATRVISVEFDWVPGVNDQAADRAHRIGQENKVLVQYVVFPNSIDGAVITANLHKRLSIRLL